MTVLSSWGSRRLRVPKGLVLHLHDLDDGEVEWKGAIKITKPLRTVVDCTVDAVEPNLVKQTVDQGTRRGHFTRAQVRRPLKEHRV